MLIFFDIDGTLIGEKSHIMLESTKRAIQKARANGHICLINTGRSRKLVGPDITGLTEFDGLALGCGTMVVYRGKTLLHRTFSEEESIEIIRGLRKYRIDAVLEGSNNNYNDSPQKMFSPSFAEFIKQFESQEYGSYEDAVGHFDKFYAYVEDAARMLEFQAEFREKLDFVDRNGGYYEIMPKGFSKASAIKFVADALDIPMGQTVAIGDSSNDIPMLECAAVAIVMGNAAEEVKGKADFVTTDVDEDGIWNALEWLGALE